LRSYDLGPKKLERLFNYIDANALINQLHAPHKARSIPQEKPSFANLSIATLSRTFLPGSVEKFGSSGSGQIQSELLQNGL
jgi:hypothetical protein